MPLIKIKNTFSIIAVQVITSIVFMASNKVFGDLMKIPDREECFKIIHENEMMGHIIKHSVMVCKVSEFLCVNLKGTFPELNIELAKSAALLHDITKTRSFTTGEKHSDTGGKLVKDLGFTETGDIIRQHVFLDEYNDTTPVTEAEIINYSDKRVLHDSVVPLEKRLEYIYDRYVTHKEFIKHFDCMKKNTYLLETKLFKHLDFKPDALKDLIIKL